MTGTERAPMGTRHSHLDSPLGVLTLVAEDDGLSGIYFTGHARRPDDAVLGPRLRREHDTLLAATADQLIEYFAGERQEFSLLLAPSGSELQRRVWSLLRDIPFGETRRYGDLAAELGQPGMAQAVGQAVGRNPLSIVVPCHRIVGSSGKLVGFAGGVERKRFLLELEEPAAAQAGRLF